jgi:uncharacterized protein YegJ (DUF2314 family)
MNQLVIGIPGPWEDRNAVIGAIANANSDLESPRFLAAGGIIMDMKTELSYGFDIYDHDQNMRHAFEAAGQGRFSHEELDKIKGHKYTVYLVYEKPFSTIALGSLDAARQLIELGIHLLNAGGFAVKIEHSGIAHTEDRWRYYARQGTTLSLYDAFVTMVGSREFNYTCGMHTFGMPDVSLTSDISIDDAPEIINGFNQYQILEKPELYDGTLFATSNCMKPLKISHCSYGYDEEELLNNPYGRWHLELSYDPPPPNTTKYQLGGEPLFMALGQNDPEVLESIKQARSTLPWFIDNFKSPYEYGHYLVKIHIREEDAYLWTLLIETNDDGLIVELFEMPKEFVNYKVGQQLRVHNNDIYDWSIERNGTLIGGFSRRIHRKHIAIEERQQYDLYSGTIAYAPFNECLQRS